MPKSRQALFPPGLCIGRDRTSTFADFVKNNDYPDPRYYHGQMMGPQRSQVNAVEIPRIAARQGFRQQAFDHLRSVGIAIPECLRA